MGDSEQRLPHSALRRLGTAIAVVVGVAVSVWSLLIIWRYGLPPL